MVDYNEIVDKVNAGEKMQIFAEQIGVSKRTLQRRLNSEGFFFDKELKKYVKKDKNVDMDDILVNNEDIGKNETMSATNRSFTVYDDIHRALKLKAVLEDTDMSKIVNDALKQYIESKYFNLNI